MSIESNFTSLFDWVGTLAAWDRAIVAHSGEFWSGIIGACVGGAISSTGQLYTIRETRMQRIQDLLRSNQAHGHALLFKAIRIHSNFVGISRQIEGCFKQAKSMERAGEPWSFILPLGNFPDLVRFASDEMGMLLGFRGNTLFDDLGSLDD